MQCLEAGEGNRERAGIPGRGLEVTAFASLRATGHKGSLVGCALIQAHALSIDRPPPPPPSSSLYLPEPNQPLLD